jgi:AcrR family transcriptional regulator
LPNVDGVHIGSNDNSVNMAGDEKRKYHHGDLRAALIQEGLRLLEERHGDDVGLREVARAAGVSATAVYRHFPDKAALLRALSAEGLARLAAAQREAHARAGGGRAGFLATGRAYIRFALASPALFRLVFSNPPERNYLAGADDSVPEAFRLLRENAASVVPLGADAESLERAALEAWARVHGLAMLMLDGQIPPDERLIDAVIGASSDVRSG